MYNKSIPNPKQELFLIRCSKLPIYKQLQLEEALLRTQNTNFCLMNSMAPPAIVLGSSAKSEEILTKEIQTIPFPIIRRFSGGGHVVIDHNTIFVTWICRNKDFSFPPYPANIMQWSEAFYKSLFGPLPFALRENDYVLNDLKIGGNAQYLQKDRWLHHTSFLWDYNPEMMDLLTFPKKRPSYRKMRSHSEFLTTLKKHFPSKEVFLNNLLDLIHFHFHVKEVNFTEVEAYLNLPHRKTTTVEK